jgi:hypothetical protein
LKLSQLISVWCATRQTRWRFAGLALLVAACSTMACTSSAYVEADAPVTVATYPHVYEDGYVYYWVGDRWYVQRDGVWFYYRTEPPFLYRHRVHWVGTPHRHWDYYRRPYASPYRRSAPPVRRSAPPARRAAPPAFHRH